MSTASQLVLFAPVPRAVARAAFSASPRPPAVAPLPPPKPLTPVEHIPTGLADLDRFLGGGLPRGEVVELCGGPSSGKATLALGTSLGVLAGGGRAAWIDPGSGFWPLAALEAGAPADRLVVVRTPDDAAACRAADILLAAAGAVDLVVVDLASRGGPREARITRLHRLAERGGATLLFLSGRPEGAASLGALVGLRLTVRRRPDSPVLEVSVARWKRGPDHRTFAAPHHEPDRLRLDTTI